MTNPENGYVEGFYYQDLDTGVVKHYIFNCPMTWEVDPSSVHIIRHDDLPLPESDCAKILQTADYLASRKEILDFKFID